LLLKGKVKQLASDKSMELKEAKIKIFRKDINGDERYFQTLTITNDKGDFNLPLESNQDDIVRVEKEGYLSEEQELSTKNQLNNKSYQLDFNLNEITEKAFQLENIYYEYEKADLTEEAFQSMDTTILKILLQNPEIIVEIG